jgi:septum site-determining protein MinD
MIAIAGGKGGSGKTTTTLGLAAALGRRGERPVAADADRDMPDLHALAGVPNEPTVAALVGGEDHPRRLGRVARPVPGHPGVAVVPAAPGVDRRELVRGLRHLKGRDPPVLVDCPAGAGPAAVDPVSVADRTLLVATATPPGLRDAVKTAALSRAVGTPVAGVVVPRRSAVPSGIERLFEAPVFPVPRAEEPLSDPAVRRAIEGFVPSVR